MTELFLLLKIACHLQQLMDFFNLVLVWREIVP